jgi:hypothetical protein
VKSEFEESEISLDALTRENTCNREVLTTIKLLAVDEIKGADTA